jgi:hypothetical protein
MTGANRMPAGRAHERAYADADDDARSRPETDHVLELIKAKVFFFFFAPFFVSENKNRPLASWS